MKAGGGDKIRKQQHESCSCASGKRATSSVLDKQEAFFPRAVEHTAEQRRDDGGVFNGRSHDGDDTRFNDED